MGSGNKPNQQNVIPAQVDDLKAVENDKDRIMPSAQSLLTQY